MPKYTVELSRTETYEIEAENPYEAEDMALELLADDQYAFLDGPIHTIIVKEI